MIALYPGQGSQHIGMGSFLLETSALARQTFEEASDALGYDMLKLCLEGPEDKLRMTENTQPALLTVSTATHRALNEKKELSIQAAAGHSVGEYAALVTAGVLPFAKALELVRLRGRLMQETVPVGKGGMLAVMGLEAGEVEKLCQWAQKESGQSPLEPANYNSPAQTVVSGDAQLIEWTQKNFSPDKINSDKKKVRLIPLKVSAPFHCSMMKTAENEMAGAINEVEFQTPLFGIVQNFTGEMETDPKRIQQNIISQISGAVRWVECMDVLQSTQSSTALEMGPGKVLSGLAKKMNNIEMTFFNFNSLEDIQSFTDRET